MIELRSVECCVTCDREMYGESFCVYCSFDELGAKYGQALTELARLRAELAAANERIAQLEASQEWEPVETAELACACGNCSVPLTVDGDMLELENDTDYFQFVLPDGYRLMRRRPQGEGQEES